MDELRALGERGDGGRFDHYARLVRRLLDAPVALVSIVETDRQVLPGVAGPLAEPYLSERSTPLSHSFCRFVVSDELPLIIQDARRDPRLASSPAIEDLRVVAYAGWPLVDARGATVGSLCAMDSVPRDWSEDQVSILEDLAHACSAEIQSVSLQARESEALARTIFTSVDVGMAFYDVDENLLMANALAQKVADACGFSLEQPPYAGPHVRRSHATDPIPYDEQLVPRALRGDLEPHELEWIGPPGNQQAILGSWRQVLHSDGTPWGTLVTAHDVTDLARLVLLKDEFISTVSHELRTPLTSILGYLELLDDEIGTSGGFVTEALSKIESNAVRLHERVQQLLDTADRRRRLELEPIDVYVLAQRVLLRFEAQAQEADVSLRLEPSPATWATVDASKIEQVLENLVSNALKYTPAHGHVVVAMRDLEQDVELSVTDDGIGMSPDEVNQAFETFWRSASAAQSAVPGFGIGLTFVRDIIESHHGHIHIESRPGDGSRLTVTVPRSGGDSDGDFPPSAAGATETGHVLPGRHRSA